MCQESEGVPRPGAEGPAALAPARRPPPSQVTPRPTKQHTPRRARGTSGGGKTRRIEGGNAPRVKRPSRPGHAPDWRKTQFSLTVAAVPTLPRPTAFPRRAPGQGGFTLIEISIAIALMLLIIALAIPAVDGVMAAGRLRESMERVMSLASHARDHAMKDGRATVMIWERKRIMLVSDALGGQEPEVISEFAPKQGEEFKLYLPGAMEKDPAPEWTFWSTGNCEPAVVRYSGPAGNWELEFSPLSGRAEIKAFQAR